MSKFQPLNNPHHRFIQNQHIFLYLLMDIYLSLSHRVRCHYWEERSPENT